MAYRLLSRISIAVVCCQCLANLPVSAQDNLTLSTKAQEVLRRHCYSCHGQNGSNEGGFNFILRPEKLTAGGKFITPGDSEGSYLMERITNGEMPPKGKTPRPGPEDIEWLQKWIDAGAPAFDQGAERRFIRNAEIIRKIVDDLKSTQDRERRFLRYFTITHLYNAGFSEDELQTYRMALAKLVNSLSWNRQVVQAKPIDPAQTILRVDLRDLKWNDTVWDSIVQANPYGIEFMGPEAKTCYEYAETTTPFVRGDWFVAAASRPPLYHQLLQLPESAAELERILHVEVASNIRQETVNRAGFSRSGVSQNNRIIERHETTYGAYWKSYDFASNVGRKNILGFPTGPGSQENEFQPDGGEIIFSLANGLQGYMLVDAAGRRIDKGPTTIVSDAKRPDRAVTTGISCMSCHYDGIIKKIDEVRPHVEANRRSFPNANDILAIYPPHEKLEELMDQDIHRYRAAVEQLGLTISETGEPVVNMALRFEDDVDLRLAASEVGLQPNEFISQLNRNPDLSRSLGILKIPGSVVKRDAFVAAFPDFVLHAKIGVALRFSKPATRAVLSQESPPTVTRPPGAERPGAKSSSSKNANRRDPVREAGVADEEVLKQLLVDLKSSDARLHRNSAERLQSIAPLAEGDPRRAEVATALLVVAHGNDPWAPSEAVKALGQWSTKEQVPQLIKLLQEKSGFPDIRVRKELLVILGSVPDPRTAEVLAGFLTDFHSRSEASNALKRIGSVSERPVAKLLANQDPWVRQEACKILKNVGTRNCLNSLVAVTKDQNISVARAASDAVREINARGGRSIAPR